MNFYKFNYFANFAQQQGEMWADSKWEVEQFIKAANGQVTGIDAWVA